MEEGKKSAGRPTKYSEALSARLCELLEGGNTRKAACHAVGIGETTLAVWHELYHCVQATDRYGLPKFDPEGNTVWALRGHDVEEFIGVVKRYGPTQDVAKMIRAAEAGPTVAASSIASSCGACRRLAGTR